MTFDNQDIPADETDPYYAGDYLELDVDVVDGQGNPYDLTGATIEYIIGSVSTPDLRKSSASSSDVAIVDATAGRARITISGADTADLGGHTLRHRIRITDSSGRTITTTAGHIAVSE